MMDFNFNFGEMTHFERKKLYEFVLRFKPKNILECGSGLGASTYIMSNAIGDDCKIYSCDPDRRLVFNSDKMIF
jgi:predicted O-methyltransferase YrrM